MSCGSPSATSCRPTCACCAPTGWSATRRCSPASRCRRRSAAIRSRRRSPPWTSPRARSWAPSCATEAGWASSCATGGRTEFGAIALQLGERQPQTAFQLGLRDFSLLLVRVTAVLAGSILVINVVLGRSLLESVLFALAIAVGLTPQLLPAIVTISLSTGAKRLAERKVVVKRLVSIEDLGNIVVLFTDKTGTLTEGSITFAAALDAAGQPSDAVLRAGLLCNDATFSDGRVVGGNQLDQALWKAPGARAAGADGARRLAAAPSTTSAAWRRSSSKATGGERQVIVKGAPEIVLARCSDVPPEAQAVLDAPVRRRQPRDRRRHARRRRPHDPDAPTTSATSSSPASSRSSIARRPTRTRRSTAFGASTCRSRSSPATTTASPRRSAPTSAWPSTGRSPAPSSTSLDDAQLAAALPQTTIFARVTPEQKSRIIKAQRALGRDGRLPRRRRQRRRRPARRRRRDLRRDRDRRGQGRRRHRAARQGPRHPRRRRRRGPAHLRQHDQVRPDGHLVELREHVQRRRPPRSS